MFDLLELCDQRADFPVQSTSKTLGSIRGFPSMRSLESRRVRLKFTSQSAGAIFNAEARELAINREWAQALENGGEDLRWVFYECVGRWAILLAAQKESGLDGSTFSSWDSWLKFFALRPFLYLACKQGDLPWGLLRPALRKLLEFSSAARDWPKALECFAEGLCITAQDKRGDLGKLHFRARHGRIFGFQHTRDGIVLPIFGTRSKRHLSIYNAPRKSPVEQQWQRRTANLLLPGENFTPRFWQAEVRRNFLVPLELVPCPSARIVDLGLPPNSVARELLVPGRIPITAAGDPGSGPALLISSAVITENGARVGASGRTGILFKNGLPVIEELCGVEHLVEIKGSGSVEGGMPSLMKRADGSWSPTGGLLRSYANDEYAALLDVAQGNQQRVRAAALVHFDGDDVIRNPHLIGAGNGRRRLEAWPAALQEQVRDRLSSGLGMIFRLVPSSERLSFFELAVTSRNCPRRHSSSVLDRIETYGAAIAGLFIPGEMKAHLSAHLENLVSGDFGFFWQDFADILPLYVSRAHYTSPDFVSRKSVTMRLLNQVFFYVARTAQMFHEYFQVDYSEVSSRFYRAFARQLKSCWPLRKDFLHELTETREPLRVRGVGINSFLWKGWIASDNFCWCLKNYDLPAIIFGQKVVPSAPNAELERTAAVAFLRAEREFLEEAASPAGLEQPACTSESHLLLAESKARSQELLARVEAGRNVTVADCMLPYLQRSSKCTLPRKVESWPK